MRKVLLIICLFLSVYTSAQWSELGGLNGLSAKTAIYSICSDNFGNIYAAGHFMNTSGNRYVAKWNGSTWSELGGINGLSANNIIITIYTNVSGNLFAAGAFSNVNGSSYVAKYNGSSWSELGGLNGLSANGAIFSICSDVLGNVYTAGNFSNSTGNKYVAKWNGSSWSELGGLNGLSANNDIRSICSDAVGNIYAAGSFTNSSGKYYVAKWNGSSWGELGGLNGLSANNYFFSICTDAANNVYAAGSFTNSSGKYYVAKWNGSSWSELGGLNGLSANGAIFSICSDDLSNVYAAGDFINSSGNRYVAKWSGSSWSELGGLNGLSANNYFSSICTNASGSLYAAGGFKNSNGKYYVAKYTQSASNTINGRIITLLSKPVKKTTLNYLGSSASSVIVDSTGNYYLNLNAGNYTLRPTKNNDITKANGVTSIDALLTQRHILNTTKLNSAYKLIAADVDGNKAINSVDVLRMKRLILGTDTTFTSSTKGNRLWEFVDSAYQFPDTTNPFPFKDSISFTNLTSNKINQTFIGIKLGDVNYDWNAAVAKQSTDNSIQLTANIEVKVINGELRIPITVNNFKDIAAMQYTLHFDNAKYKFVNLEGFKNLESFEYNAAQANTNGNISMLWTDKNAEPKTLEDGTELFTLVLRSTADSRLSTDLTLTSDITEVEAWDKDFIKHNIVLTKRETRNDKLETRKEIVIYPNPTKGLVNLYIETFAGKGNIAIADVYGNQVKTQALSIGTNTFDIAKLSKGIYFVSIITSEGKTTKKLVVE